MQLHDMPRRSLLQDFQDLYHTVHADPSSRAKVPILQDGDLTLIESALTVRTSCRVVMSDHRPQETQLFYAVSAIIKSGPICGLTCKRH